MIVYWCVERMLLNQSAVAINMVRYVLFMIFFLSFRTEDFHVNNKDDVNSTNNGGQESSLPEFVGHVPNVTAQVGREARLACIIRNLASYSVSF